MESQRVLAEHSYEELMSLLDWFARRGPIPTIIGGWAVYFYNSYLGSADVDLVGYSMGGLFDETLSSFERSRGYEEVAGPLGLVSSYRRKIEIGGKIAGYIEIDACSYESDTRVFHEDEEKELPYRLCSREELVTRVNLGDGREAFIPRKPLLFLYKLKAFRDRMHDLRVRRAVLSASRREWLRAKWIKDGSDMIALLDPEPVAFVVEGEFDTGILHNLVEEFKLDFALESIRQLPSLVESTSLYSYAEEEEIRDWVNDLLG